MIRISVTRAALGGVRFFSSPMWEALSAARLLARHRDETPWPYDSWAQAALRALRGSPARHLLDVIGRLRVSGLPASMSPDPGAPEESFHEQLERFRHTPQRVFGLVLPDAPPVGVFADSLAAFWEEAITAHWPVIRSAADADLAYRAHTLATRGGLAVLSGLHRRVSWSDDALCLAGDSEQNVALGRQSLLICVGLVFSRGAPLLARGESGDIAFSYPARGSAILAGSPRARDDATPAVNQLAILMGPRRAELMRALVAPTTTSALSAQLNLALSTVSEHLSALVAADVVERRRSGGKVFYSLNPCGIRIVDQLGGTGLSAGSETVGTPHGVA